MTIAVPVRPACGIAAVQIVIPEEQVNAALLLTRTWALLDSEQGLGLPT